MLRSINIAGTGMLAQQLQVEVISNNIANLNAPRSYANAPINYDIYTYDQRGRSFYVRLSAQF
jgi:flagellar basal body rod protein FlgC